MTTISDTTPIRYLVEIEEVRILEELFGKVIIPEKVVEELQRPKTPQRVKEWIQAPPAWLDIRRADLSFFTPKTKIQAGEWEAIALAIELNAGLLLIDDTDAIREAQRLNLPTMRLFTILKQAAKRNLLDLSETVEKMRQTSFHLPPAEFVEAMLERDQQRNQTNQKFL